MIPELGCWDAARLLFRDLRAVPAGQRSQAAPSSKRESLELALPPEGPEDLCQGSLNGAVGPALSSTGNRFN